MMPQLGYDRRLENPSISAWDVSRMQLQRATRFPLQVARYLRYRPAYLVHLLWRKWKLRLLREFLWEINF